MKKVWSFLVATNHTPTVVKHYSENRFIIELKKNYQNFLLLLAMIGAIILYFTFGSSKYGPFSSRRYTTYGTDNYNWEYLLVIFLGTCLILPYIIYILRKNTSKKELKGERLDLNKIGHTIESYFRLKAKKGIVEIYVFNETAETLIVNRNSLLKPNVWYIFTLTKHKSLYFSNGIEFHLTRELHLETYDHRNQVIGLGGNFLKKYDVPNYVDWAFVISQPNQGDNIE